MILSGFNTIQVIHTASGRCCCNQAGDRIARIEDYRFNTASGRYCCNLLRRGRIRRPLGRVSIPQAVSTVATGKFEGGLVESYE